MFAPPFDAGRRRALQRLGVAACAVAGASWAAADDVPITGDAQPALQPFDDLMTSFIAQHDVPGASLAVTYRSRLVYARGFGYADRDQKTPVQPESLFRIASVSKPLTAVTLLQLVEKQKFDLSERFLDLVPIEPESPARPDLRVREITVRQLLQHTAGWDRDRSGDPIATLDVSRALEIDPPPGPSDIIRYTLGRELDFAPGERFAYSNVGYLCLGRIIEKFAGKSYQDAVKDAILQPLGIRRVQLGHAHESQRIDGEVRYYDRLDRSVPALVGPTRRVPLQYGGENFGNFEAHGGWIASAVDLVRFAAAFDDAERCPLLSAKTMHTMWDRPQGMPGYRPNGNPRESYYGCGWNVRPIGSRGLNTWHAGLIAGTSSLLVRRWDGLNWAVLFNTDRAPGRGGQPLAGVIDPLVHGAADAVREWPEHNLFAQYLAQQ